VGAILITILLLFAAAVLLSVPLWAAPGQSYTPEQPPAPTYTERDALLEAMSELELSFGAGKLSPDDYERQKARLQQEYVVHTADAG
jgi:hypothetical protein